LLPFKTIHNFQTEVVNKNDLDHPRNQYVDIPISNCIPQEYGPPKFVFLVCDLPGGISPLQELQRRLHLPVSSSPHWHHKGKEHNPEKDPEKPPKPMHSPK
jgi:hypothetical protein